MRQSTEPNASTPQTTRRGLFGFAALGGVAAVGSAAATSVSMTSLDSDNVTSDNLVVGHTYSPYGEHQAGILTPTPAAIRCVALSLLATVKRDDLDRLMRLWTTDIVNAMEGEPIPGDTAPDLASAGRSLTITLGLGPAALRLSNNPAATPPGFVEIPPMTHDDLQNRWSGGDLLLLVQADDLTTVDYAVRRLVRDAKPFAKVAWVQTGSWRGTNAEGAAVTGRNLFGQVDGTGNPSGDDRDRVLWYDEPGQWYTGGTTMVIRRIEMDLDLWDRVPRIQQESSIGRKLSNGAPLTGENENDPPDFSATENREPVIPLDAHVRLAHPDFNNGRQIVRRGFNYVDSEVVDGEVVESSGLIFTCFQQDIASQFIPIQRRLDQSDALNEWTTAIGSSVWVIPGGFDDQSYLAQGLFS